MEETSQMVNRVCDVRPSYQGGDGSFEFFLTAAALDSCMCLCRWALGKLIPPKPERPRIFLYACTELRQQQLERAIQLWQEAANYLQPKGVCVLM